MKRIVLRWRRCDEIALSRYCFIMGLVEDAVSMGISYIVCWFIIDNQQNIIRCWKFVVFLFEKLLLFHKKSLTLQVVSLCSRRYVG